MITKLTKEQEKQFKIYSKKYIEIGTDTGRIDSKRAQVICNNLYEHILNRPKVPVIIFPNPEDAWKAVCTFVKKGAYEKYLKDGKLEGEIVSFVWPHIDGQFYASYFAFYDYMHEVLGVDLNCDKYKYYRDTLELSLVFPLDEVCVLSDKPSIIHMEDGVLHKDLAPCLEYEEGFKLYQLHGIPVPEWLVMTEAKDLPCKKLYEIENVDVRREFIRKIGLDRLAQELEQKVIDSYNNYELITLNLGDDRHRPFLKMVNPSTNDIHIEGVKPDIKTVKEALCFRNGLEKWIEPDILT